MTGANAMPDSEQTAMRQQRPAAPRGAICLLAALAALALTLAGCATHPPQPQTADAPADAPAAIQSDQDSDPRASPPLDADAFGNGLVKATGAESPLLFEPAAMQATVDTRPASIEPPPEIWQRLRAGFRLDHPLHPRVEREIRRLQRSPSAFHALMTRSEPYIHHILDAVQAAGLPTELALLPAVESGFRPHVYSPDGAAGLWQFMPATGSMLGLHQNWWFDRRRTVRQSTRAATRYLRHLEQRFDGDWLHALAAYNAGQSKVARAIRNARRRGAPTDFWSLDLPGETDHYVPQLLALARIVESPAAYGLELPDIPDAPYFVMVDTRGQIDLHVAAELAGIGVDELLALNAGNKRWASDPDGPYVLLLPVEHATRFEQGVAALPADQRLRWRRHRIVPGDTLSGIARQYGVGIGTIARANGLTDSRIRAGSHLLIPSADSAVAADLESRPATPQKLRYRVRKGDSLYTIARRFRVSVADLRRWNQVGRYLYPGDRLTVFIDPDV